MKQIGIEQLEDFTIVVTYERGDGTTFQSRNGFHEKYGYPSPPQPLASIRTRERFDKAQEYLDKILAERRPEPNEILTRLSPVKNRAGEYDWVDTQYNALESYVARLTGAQKDVNRLTDLLNRILEMENE